MQAECEADEARRRAEARERAAAIWRAAPPADDGHPYLARKGIKANGLRLHKGALVVPIRDADGVLHSLQFIDEDGTKRYLTGGRVAGCYFSIGKPGHTVCIAEGYATGATIHEATGYPVAVAFNTGNLEAVARTLRARLPNARIVVCADDDAGTAGNPGRTKASEAARAITGLVAVPDFGATRPDGATDFNDMATHRGLEAVERAIANAKAPEVSKAQPGAENAPAGDSDGWPVPLPLVAKVAPEPYPADALPDTIRAVVEEVQRFTKAPIALVASSALASLSVAIQAHVDVQRADKLQGPVSLFLLTIADSGERKSTCDGFFSTAIRDYQEQQSQAAKPDLAKYRADVDAWKAMRDGLTDAIRAKARKQNTTGERE
jgi:putative DNA primase/helicase